MRKFKRWWRHALGEYKIRDRRRAVAQALQAQLQLDAMPRLIPSGQRGHDSIYFVQSGNAILGVLRLINPYKHRPVPASNMPFIALGPVERIEREARIYEAGERTGLTPKVLWRDRDAVLCAYLDYSPLQDRLLRQPSEVWPLLCRATVALHQLHGEGITHMDASFANILASDSLDKLVFIDFEYGPRAGLSVSQQQVYDYLRLAESVWKFIPESVREGYGVWLDCLQALLTPAQREVDLSPLAPALQRVLQAEGVGMALRNLFPISHA